MIRADGLCQFGELYGLKIIEDPNMVEDGEPCEVRRTWRERLFSRPWRPLQATRTVVPKVPRNEAFQFGHTIVMHPETARKMREQLRNQT